MTYNIDMYNNYNILVLAVVPALIVVITTQKI